MALGARKQDVYTKEEFQKHVIPKMTRGKYQVDIGENGEDIKVSSISNRWIQREDVLE